MQPSGDSVPNPAVPPVPPTPAPAMPPVPPMPPQPAVSDVPAATPASPAGQTQRTPVAAEDRDLIEKEWVAQVKRIVQATAHDPYELTKQFTNLKAEYMQKRYGKTIKSDE